MNIHGMKKKDFLDWIIASLEKQIPAEPDDVTTCSYPRCRACGSNLQALNAAGIVYNARYCPNCGQLVMYEDDPGLELEKEIERRLEDEKKMMDDGNKLTDKLPEEFTQYIINDCECLANKILTVKAALNQDDRELIHDALKYMAKTFAEGCK